MAEKLHDAFISYSRKDRAFATLLEKALEDFSPPKIGTIPQKHLDIFRDKRISPVLIITKPSVSTCKTPEN